eukprot:Sdes_comp19093_c1_seq1m9747
MIAIITLASGKRRQQKSMHRIPKIIRLLGLAIVPNPNMRKHLLLQNLTRILDAAITRHSHGGSSRPNIIQRNQLLLNHKGFLQARFQHLSHLGILKIIHNMLQNIAIRNKPQRAKYHNNRNILPNVRNRSVNQLPQMAPTTSARSRHHFHVHCAGGSCAAFQRGANFSNVRKFGGLFFFEYIHLIVAHFFLRNQHFFRAVDHKISPLITNTLVHIGQLPTGHVVQKAVLGLEHDRNLANVYFGEHLRAILDLLVFHIHTFRNVHVERRRIGQVSKTRLVRKHRLTRTIRFCKGRLAQINLPKINYIARGIPRLFTGVVLILRLHIQIRCFVDNFLHRVRDKLIK